jgi:hypothetical protein
MEGQNVHLRIVGLGSNSKVQFLMDWNSITNVVQDAALTLTTWNW